MPPEEVGFPAAAFSSGRTHHELLLIEVGEEATPIPRGHRFGLNHSLYIEDPDGNEIELYIDVQPALWKDDPAAIFARPRPLRL